MLILDKLYRRWADLIIGRPNGAAAAGAGPVQPQPEPDLAPRPRQAGAWPLDRALLQFRTLAAGGRDAAEPFTLANAYEGVFVTGGVGSGKTSGSGRHLAAALLQAGAGGLVMVAKPEETADWQRYAQEAGREGDLVVFSEEKQSGFNFLDYEMQRTKGNPAEAATNVLMEVVEAVAGGRKASGDSQMWMDYAKELIQNALNLCLLAGQSVSVAQVFKLAGDDAAVDAMLEKAQARAVAGELNASQSADLEAVREYLAGQWRSLDERPKSSVLLTASGAGRTFRLGAMRDLFTGKTTITPDDILAGKIVVVNCPVMQYAEAGKAANIVWKYCLQRAIQRRGRVRDTDRPTFIFADECHYFVTKRDAEFVTTSRSAGCANIYLTQNRPNLLARLDEPTVDGLLGCFATKIWHSNSDPKTNEWAADSVAKVLQTRTNTSTSYNVGGSNNGPGGGGGTSSQQVLDHDLPPRSFMELAKGGAEFQKVVTAYLFRSGQVFASSGKIYVLVGFHQEHLELGI